MPTFSTKILLIGLFCFGCFSQIKAQCKYVSPATLRQLARAPYSKKINKLNKKNATQVIEKKEGIDCDATTFTLCKNYISDEQWHWDEIISFSSCDKILTYSTSNEMHFKKIKKILTRRYKPIGTRNYSGLDFEIFQDKKGQALEINAHPNQEGIIFYLINIIRTK